MKYGTTHIGSIDHLAVLGFAEAAKMTRPTIIPFRGGGDIVINLVAGNIDAALSNYGESETQIQAGGVGYVMRLSNFSPGTLVMGLVLGIMVEETLKQSLLMFDHDWFQFFSRPIVVVLFAVTLVSFLIPLILGWMRGARCEVNVVDE